MSRIVITAIIVATASLLASCGKKPQPQPVPPAAEATPAETATPPQQQGEKKQPPAETKQPTTIHGTKQNPTAAAKKIKPATQKPTDEEVDAFYELIGQNQYSEAKVLAKLEQNPALAAVVDHRGIRPILVSAAAGQTAVVKWLVDAGTNPNETSGTSRRTSPLFQAASNNKIDVARLLLERGAEPNLPEAYGPKKGKAPLHVAVHYIELVKLLVSRGANVNAVNQLHNRTPVDYAIRSNCNETIKFLRSKGGMTYEELVASGATIE